MPTECCDDDELRGKMVKPCKCRNICTFIHARLNAILNRSSGSLEALSCLCCTAVPPADIAKAIIQNGIKEVVYMSDKYADGANTITSKERMFDMVGIKYRIYEKTEN